MAKPILAPTSLVYETNPGTNSETHAYQPTVRKHRNLLLSLKKCKFIFKIINLFHPKEQQQKGIRTYQKKQTLLKKNAFQEIAGDLERRPACVLP